MISNRDPGMTLSGDKIVPAEIDRYEIFQVINPIYGTINIGTFNVAGTAALGTLAFATGNVAADYPRNVIFRLTGTSTGLAGTATLYGYNQFGVYQNESFGFGSTDNGATVVGTKVFATISAGTLSYGTAVGNGTAGFSFGTAGTTTLFGLPFKVGGTKDLKILSVSSNHVAGSVSGQGTLGGYLDIVNHAIKAPINVAGTAYTLVAWVKPTYNAVADPNMANLSQRV